VYLLGGQGWSEMSRAPAQRWEGACMRARRWQGWEVGRKGQRQDEMGHRVLTGGCPLGRTIIIQLK